MEIEKTLERIVNKYEGVKEAVAITPDGFVIGFYPKNREESGVERISAMGASLIALAQRMSKSFNDSELKEVVLKTDRGSLIGYPISKDLFVFVWVSG